MYSEKILERFWSKVNVFGETECWPWTRNRTREGYGLFALDGTYITASSFCLELKLHRPILEDYKALHTCDNPPCCNPVHLFEGTMLQNVHDMIDKGRSCAIKFTEEQLHEILHGGETLAWLSTKLGVSVMTVSSVRNGKHPSTYHLRKP